MTEPSQKPIFQPSLDASARVFVGKTFPLPAVGLEDFKRLPLFSYRLLRDPG
jgi:hypothetical protein